MRPEPLDAWGFAEIFPVSRETLARFEAYAELLTRWSARINLIGRDTVADLWRRHFLDSAQLRPLVPDDTQSLIDLGSGAGFPGLVLAILGVPGIELVEADSRKAAFLREAARVTKANVTIRTCRADQRVSNSGRCRDRAGIGAARPAPRPGPAVPQGRHRVPVSEG